MLNIRILHVVNRVMLSLSDNVFMSTIFFLDKNKSTAILVLYSCVAMPL